MLGAVMFGHEQMQAAINAILALKAEAGKPSWDWSAEPEDEALKAKVAEHAQAAIESAYQIEAKAERLEAFQKLVINW